MSKNTHHFELAVRAFSTDLYRYAYWLSRSASEAEDLVQECFLLAWSNWQQLKDDKAVKQWLLVILRREFLRRMDKKQLSEFESIDEVHDLPEGLPALDETYSVRQALARAPISLRDPLLLQVIGGFSCEEIAEIEQTSSGAVMTRLTRARQWFRSALKSPKEAAK